MSDNHANRPPQQGGNNQQGGNVNTGDVSGGSVAGRDVTNRGNVNTEGGGYSEHDLTDNRTTNNVIGTQNNVRGNQFNSGRDQFIGNRNVTTGEGDIHDYGGVTGNVNSGSGSQTNVRTGNISGNQGNIAVGSGISQTYGGSGSTPPVSPEIKALRKALRQASDDLFDMQISSDERTTVRGALNAAISALESDQVSEAAYLTLSNAVDALANLNVDTRSQRSAITQAAAAAGWEL